MGKFRVALRVPVLYIKIGPCNLSPKPKHRGMYLNLLNRYGGTIFVLPDLGTDQGMSTKLGDQKIHEKFA